MKKGLFIIVALLGSLWAASAAELAGEITAVDKGTVTAGEGGTAYVKEGDIITLTVKLTAKELTQDLSFSAIQPYESYANPADILAITPKTLKADEVDQTTIQIAIRPSAVGNLLYAIDPGSAELSSYYINIKLYVEPKTAGALGEFIASNPTGTEGIEATVEGDFVVTHVWQQPFDNNSWQQTRAYLQDASAGVFVHYYEPLTCKVGDHYSKITGILYYNSSSLASEGMYGIEGIRDNESPLPAPTDSNKFAEPTVITLAEVAKHHGRLVHIKRVTVSEAQALRSDVLAIDDVIDFTANSLPAKITFFPGSDLLGEPASTITGVIDLVGIVRTVGEGKITISPRSKADILPASEEVTALESITIDNMATKVIENGQLYILKDGVRYSILGIKQGNNN